MIRDIQYFKDFFKMMAEETNVKNLKHIIYKNEDGLLAVVYKKETNDLFLEYNEERVISEKLNDKLLEFCQKIVFPST